MTLGIDVSKLFGEMAMVQTFFFQKKIIKNIITRHLKPMI